MSPSSVEHRRRCPTQQARTRKNAPDGLLVQQLTVQSDAARFKHFLSPPEPQCCLFFDLSIHAPAGALARQALADEAQPPGGLWCVVAVHHAHIRRPVPVCLKRHIPRLSSGGSRSAQTSVYYGTPDDVQDHELRFWAARPVAWPSLPLKHSQHSNLRARERTIAGYEARMSEATFLPIEHLGEVHEGGAQQLARHSPHGLLYDGLCVIGGPCAGNGAVSNTFDAHELYRHCRQCGWSVLELHNAELAYEARVRCVRFRCDAGLGSADPCGQSSTCVDHDKRQQRHWAAPRKP